MGTMRAAVSMVMIFGGTLLSPSIVLAQLSRAGIVTTLQGTATVARAVLPQPLPLKFKDDVFVHDRITTGNDSVARILLGGKAIVTVRERTVLTITEMPGASTLELGTGRIALAVVKERMKPGESIDIRTPNAVAAIRGTVVVAEVSQATAQAGSAPGAFSTTITVLRGAIEFTALDPLTRRPTAPPLSVGVLQRVGVTGAALPRSQTITPEAAGRLASEFKPLVKEAPAATRVPLVRNQVRATVNRVSAQLPAAPSVSPPQSAQPATGGSKGDQTTSQRGDAASGGSGTTSGSSSSSSGSSSSTKSSPGGSSSSGSFGSGAKTGGAPAGGAALAASSSGSSTVKTAPHVNQKIISKQIKKK